MVKAKAMGLFRDSQGPSWLSEPRTDVPAESSSHRRWLSALLRFMDSDYTFGIFKFFLKLSRG